MFMPPVKPSTPSTTMILRWLRRLAACSRAGTKGALKMPTGMPSAASALGAARIRLDQRGDELRADAVAVEDVGGEHDRAARAADRLEHRRIGLGAVDEGLDGVSRQQRAAADLAHQ